MAANINSGQSTPGQRSRDPGVYARAARRRANQIANNPQLQSLLSSGGLFPRAALLGGAFIPGLLAGKEELDEGRPAAAIGSVAAGIGGAYGAQSLAQRVLGDVAKRRGIPGLIGKIGMVAAPIIGGSIGSSLGGDIAEYGKRAVTGEPIKGATDLKNTLAAQKQVQDFLRQVDVDSMSTFVSGQTQLYQNMANAERQHLEKLEPFIGRQLDNALVRQQALINSQGNVYAKLGTIATAGKLATGAQAETGATVRALISQNPYANAIISAPSISFG